LSCLIIDNENEFIDILEEYIKLEIKLNRRVPNFVKNKERNKIKWIMAYLFVNATIDDFIRPVEYLKRKIAFLRDETFSYLDNGITIDIGEYFVDSKLEIKNNRHSVAMESPYRIDMSLINYIEKFVII